MSELLKKGSAPLTTVMLQSETPERILSLAERSVPLGAEAFGIQLEQLLPEYRSKETYKRLFGYRRELPKYVTNYRPRHNSEKSDEQLARELIELAEQGADICDVMGDCFDRQPGEMTYDRAAVKKQEELIKELHRCGSMALISSHIFKFTPAEEVLRIALEHQERGADISKIVVGADTVEQELENLRIINLLKNSLDIPFLLLSSGECRLLRRIGGELGCCMYLCVYEHDSLATPQQPLLTDITAIRSAMRHA